MFKKTTILLIAKEMSVYQCYSVISGVQCLISNNCSMRPARASNIEMVLKFVTERPTEDISDI